MSMKEVSFQGWRFLCDGGSTRDAYARASDGVSENCDCAYCRNFAAQRSSVYDHEQLQFFEAIGVDFRKVRHCSHAGREEGGHLYLWIFRFVGSVLAEPSQNLGATGEPTGQPGFSPGKTYFSFFVGRGTLVEELTTHPQIEVWCEAVLPWVLHEPDPEAPKA